MSYEAIQASLDAHLGQLAGLPPLQMENTRNIAVSGQAFCRATLLPAQPMQVSVGVDGKDMNQGLYQVDLFVPTDTGMSSANALADTVIEHFPRGLALTDSGVTTHIRRAWRQAGQRIETFYQVAVVIQWSTIV